MADNLRMSMEGMLRKAAMEGDADFLREGVRMLSQALLELEVSKHLGAEPTVAVFTVVRCRLESGWGRATNTREPIAFVHRPGAFAVEALSGPLAE